MAAPRKKPTAAVQAVADQAVAELEARKRVLLAAEREEAIKAAEDRLIPYTQLTMPDPKFPDDTAKSRYTPKRHHQALAAALEELFHGRILRLIVSMPPRHGKSELTSKRFPAWVLGKRPEWEVIQATYNEEFAVDFGRMVREIIRDPIHRQVFPGSLLRTGSQSAERFWTTEGGGAAFAGMGGSITGRGADLLIGDDLIKDREQAESKLARDKAWNWFWDVFMSRMKDQGARVCLVMTRWHEDDIIGRIIDPANPCYNFDEAKKWHIIELPALAYENDPLGRAPGEPLWPERYGRDFFESIRRVSPRTFQSLYQGRPSPDDGDFFKKNMLVEYGPDELPPRKLLRVYAASDHAVSQKQTGDATCLLVVGVDEYEDIWVLPETVWRRMASDVTVENMIDLMDAHEPILWWAEDEHIRKSIGPFLEKRMQERGVYTTVDPVRPSKDKETRAQAIRARMSMKKVRFPSFAPWWPDAKQEILKFPNARHDDFVDALSHIGSGLRQITKGMRLQGPKEKEPMAGTFAWIKAAAKLEKRRRELTKMAGGF